ncbi:GtrA family protein [Flexilinea flocculi]|jgi:putative flippase GtrA|uniref:Putative flippase GtrA n=1 Tax=Flexilinea flocculi TaxID=1678840 RepID=A0A0S7BJC1_9CHLR|nr:GtrA family protein [Flexilinea flocculi]NMB94735.1 GtrA family protein [Flexilinea flocculi]GAP40453.1 putative flippase GtrA [Flexilinea flocculi]
MISFIKKPAERIRFLKFCTVGVFGAVVDFGVMNLLLQLTETSSKIASTISFIAAVISNFIWNHFWAYPDSRQKPLLRQLIQFSIVSVIGLGIRFFLFLTIENPIIQLSQKIVPATFVLSPLTVGHNITLVISIGIVLIWNFFGNRFWTYNDVK